MTYAKQTYRFGGAWTARGTPHGQLEGSGRAVHMVSVCQTYVGKILTLRFEPVEGSSPSGSRACASHMLALGLREPLGPELNLGG